MAVGVSFKDLEVDGRLDLPRKTSTPSSYTTGTAYFDTASRSLRIYDGSEWGSVVFAPIGTQNNPAASATELLSAGITTSGNYWLDLPIVGVTEVYCDLTTDGGGWMMLGYAGSTSGVGNSNHMLYHTIGTIATTRSYDQTSFSRFDVARQMSGAGTTSEIMWRVTNNSNNIMLHECGEMWNRFPGGSSASNMNMDNGGSGYGIVNMKMSNSGTGGIVTKSNSRYESGPSYPGIAWNSPYANNTDGAGSWTNYMNRRTLIYWETNGPESQGQWFHADPMNLNTARGPTYGQSRKDIEIYWRL